MRSTCASPTNHTLLYIHTKGVRQNIAEPLLCILKLPIDNIKIADCNYFVALATCALALAIALSSAA